MEKRARKRLKRLKAGKVRKRRNRQHTDWQWDRRYQADVKTTDLNDYIGEAKQ